MIPGTITVIEGPDGAGKSFAAERRYIKELRVTGLFPVMIHNSTPHRNVSSRALFHEYMTQLKSAVFNRDRLGVSTIIDRSWPSEVIYGDVYRGGGLLTDRQIRRLERYADKHDIICVGLETNDHERRARIEARGEQWDDKQPLIATGYRHYFRLTKGWITASSTLATH